MDQESAVRPPWWLFALAFTAVYLGYGLNYLAVREGVKTVPPLLFAGAHVTSAGLILFTWLLLRRESCAITRVGLWWAAVTGIVVFVGGTGMVSLAEKTIPSNLAAILRASAPLWVALIEWARPAGERLGAVAWGGLFVAMFGVGILVLPGLESASLSVNEGVFLTLASALAWAAGAVLLRQHRPTASNVLSTAYQMSFGGVSMLLLALLLGEGAALNADELNGTVLTAFLFLLLVHSLAGFLALNWLLQYVSASLATTKFFVTPAVAIAAGYFVLGEPVTGDMAIGMTFIFAGVVLLMWKQ